MNGVSLWNPSASAPVADDAQFRQMGEQLTAQYQVAVSGMREILKFGTMLMHVRNILLAHEGSLIVQRGQLNRGGGQGVKRGLSHWLREYAPDISRSTAYRFMGIADAVATEYTQIVGVRVGETVPFTKLVLADPADLPEKEQAKQLELFEYVSGTSQKSWLDRFKAEDDTPRGGSREGAGRPHKDINAEAEMARIAWVDYLLATAEMLTKWDGRGFIHMDREQIVSLDGMLLDLRKRVKEVLAGGNVLDVEEV